MSASTWFHSVMLAAVSVGAARMLRDVLLRRHVAAVAASLSADDRVWLDTLARGVDNDREIVQGYLRNVLDLHQRDRAEAARRLAFAREQVERSALPDALDALVRLWRVLRSVPAVPHHAPSPAARLRSRSGRMLVAAAALAGALALTGKDRARVRLWLVERVLRRAARAFVKGARTPLDDTFAGSGYVTLQAAAEDVELAQAALLAVAGELLHARARWQRRRAESL